MRKIDAVNIVLTSNGLGETTSVDTSGPSDAALASRLVDEEDLRIQMRGWHYNTRKDVELSPDNSGFIYLPTGTIRIDSCCADAWRNITQVGERLYDLDNNTFVFGSSVRVSYVLRFDIECIPEPVAQWIAARAAMSFFRRRGFRVNRELVNMIADTERQAMVAAYQFDADTSNLNLNDTKHMREVLGYRRADSRVFGA